MTAGVDSHDLRLTISLIIHARLCARSDILLISIHEYSHVVIRSAAIRLHVHDFTSLFSVTTPTSFKPAVVVTTTTLRTLIGRLQHVVDYVSTRPLPAQQEKADFGPQQRSLHLDTLDTMHPRPTGCERKSQLL